MSRGEATCIAVAVPRMENTEIPARSKPSNETAMQIYGPNLRDRFVQFPLRERNDLPMKGQRHD